MIKTKDISFAYTADKQFRFPAIDLKQGEQALILGASGCGKSTYLNIIAGLNTDFEGTVLIADQAIKELKSSALDRFRGANVGVIFQESNLVQSLTVLENLQLRLTLAGKKNDLSIIDKVLDDLGILHLKKQMPQTLSIGERQRTNIALALVAQPKVLLADEPTSALDDEHAKQVIQLLKKQSEQYQISLLIITHDQRVKNDFDQHIQL